MIVNHYSILMLFMASLGLALAGVLAGTASLAAWRIRAIRGEREASVAERSMHLARLVAVVSLAMLVIGWPLLYAMLNSFVPEIPGAMCIYGVTRVMPGTSALLQSGLPGAIFVLGAWLLLEHVRRQSGRPVRRADGMLALALVAVAGLTAAAHGVELYYVCNMESLNEVSCCSSYGEAAGSKLQAPSYYLPWMIPTSTRRALVTSLFFTGIPALALWLFVRSRPGAPKSKVLALSASAALLAASMGLGWVSLMELSEVVAPRLMNLPFHHCLYCLVGGGRAPESILVVAGLGLGIFSGGWAAILGIAQQAPGKKGTGPICRDGPKGASHKLDLSPFSLRRDALGPASWAVHRRVCLTGAGALAGSMLVLLIALAVVSWGGTSESEACAMDGQELFPTLRVDFEMDDGTRPAFCSIRCARRWLENRPGVSPKEIIVRDALSGKPVDSYTAYFVRSEIVTNPANGNNIHAFQSETDAAEHIRRFAGKSAGDPFGVE